jgi:DNA-binding transcriptional LysR family regulator
MHSIDLCDTKPMLDLRELKTFRTVAGEKSFTRAANLLNYAQSSVTAQIQSLEGALGVPLFDRLGRQIELTAAGRQLLVYAERLLDLAEQAQRSVGSDGQPRGTLTVLAPETLLAYRLPELLKRFQSQFPAIHLSLSAVESCAMSSDIEPSVDIAFSLNAPLSAPHLVVQQLRTEAVVLVVAAGHPLTGKKKLRAETIAAEQVLMNERLCSYRALFERTLRAEGVSVTRSLEFLSVEAMKQCALASMGIAVLPEIVVQRELRQGSLVALDWPAKPLVVYTQVYRHRDKWMSPAMAAFWNLAVATCAADADVDPAEVNPADVDSAAAFPAARLRHNRTYATPVETGKLALPPGGA